MTRVLCELLQAREPMFHQGLQRLEAASGHLSADIRLTAEIERATRAKLRELGLDERDTTGQELYAALQERIKADDMLLQRRLQQGGIPLHQAVGKMLADLPVAKQCFALKTSIGRRILKKVSPKQTMKLLGYRSFDSMLRHEPFLAILGTAWLLESSGWRKAITEQYRKLTAADFEIRSLALVAPASAHWRVVAESVVAERKHNIVGLRESGAVVLLPFPERAPQGLAMAALLMSLHEMNDVRAASTYLKLHQVQPDFGHVVQDVARHEPFLAAAIFDAPLPWHVIQRYYSRFSDRFREDIFAPHVQKEDLSWHSIEKVLGHIEPKLAFWLHSATLGLVDDRHPVSLNVTDAALNYCNMLPYEQRRSDYLHRNLWGELVMRYLKHDAVEQMVTDSLAEKLAGEALVV